MRRELRRHLAAFDGVRILVTHDPLDAYALAERSSSSKAGAIGQTGTLDEVTARPRSRLRRRPRRHQPAPPASGHGTTFTTPGRHVVTADPVDGRSSSSSATQHRPVPPPPDGSPRNVWRAAVADIDRCPTASRVPLGGPLPLVAEITSADLDDLALHPGDRIWAIVKATDVTTYPA